MISLDYNECMSWFAFEIITVHVQVTENTEKNRVEAERYGHERDVRSSSS